MSVLAVEREKYLSCVEVAEWIGLHKSTVYSMAQDGRIPCRKVPGTDRWIFKASEVEAWLQGGEN